MCYRSVRAWMPAWIYQILASRDCQHSAHWPLQHEHLTSTPWLVWLVYLIFYSCFSEANHFNNSILLSKDWINGVINCVKTRKEDQATVCPSSLFCLRLRLQGKRKGKNKSKTQSKSRTFRVFCLCNSCPTNSCQQLASQKSVTLSMGANMHLLPSTPYTYTLQYSLRSIINVVQSYFVLNSRHLFSYNKSKTLIMDWRVYLRDQQVDIGIPIDRSSIQMLIGCLTEELPNIQWQFLLQQRCTLIIDSPTSCNGMRNCSGLENMSCHVDIYYYYKQECSHPLSYHGNLFAETDYLNVH